MRWIMVTALLVGNFQASHSFAFLALLTKGGQQIPANVLFEDGFEGRSPPMLAAIDSQVITLGSTLELQATATDTDSSQLIYEFNQAPPGMIISYGGGRIHWTPGVTDLGEHPVSLIVQDPSGLSDSTSFNVTVLNFPGDQPPVLEPIEDETVSVGAQLDIQVSASDPNEGDLLTFSLHNGPGGMSIDAATGTLNWSPDEDQAGSYLTEILVTDRTGLTDGAAFLVTATTDAPTAIDDQFIARVGETLSISAPGVLDNDFDPNDDDLAAVIVEQPSSGDLTLNADGSFDYTPLTPPLTGELKPGLEFFTNTFATASESIKSAITPAVADINLDGSPDIVFSTYTNLVDGILRAITVRETFASNVNLAIAYPRPILNVSSYFSTSSTWPAERAIDDNLNTSWFTEDDDPDIFFELEFANEITVREIQMFGNREFSSGHDMISGVFELLDSNNAVLYDSGDLAIPAPDRDIVVDVGEVSGARRVRFTPTNFEGMGSPGFDPGFSELRVIGDGTIMQAEELWAADSQMLTDSAGIAIGDIDQDGRPEIIAGHRSGAPIAFEDDGTLKWLGDAISAYGWATPTLADLDQDGVPEIIIGNVVFNNDGSIRWRGSDNGGSGSGNNGRGPISTVADLNLDGFLEVVAGNTAHFADGSVFWTSTAGDGFPGIGNFDEDPFPEVVLVDSGTVSLLEHDGTVKWGPVDIPEGGRGGAPTVADVDADGELEIGVAGGSRYVVFETDGTVKWTQETQDLSSNVTGSSVFDFQNDGQTEIVYRDEVMLYIYAGQTGDILFSAHVGSTTGHENPIVADIDNDRHAEIVTVADVAVSRRSQSGLFVFGGFDNNWIPARKIWNQHAYYVTNVNEDGSIPAREQPNWLTAGLNNFRQNAIPPDEDDDTFSYLANDGSQDSNVASVRLDIRPPSNAPAFTSVAVTAATADFPYEYVATATDPDPFDTVVFNLSEGPPGMSIVASSGLVTWAPTQSDLGTFFVSIRASDSEGFDSYQNFTLSVILPATVPNVVGLSVAQAETAITATALTVGTQSVVGSVTAPAGEVTEQSPAAGSSQAAGAPVNLTISGGPPVSTPNVVGLTLAAAELALAQTDLAVGLVVTASAATPTGQTISQNPAGGTSVPRGAQIDLTLSSGPAPLPVPNVAGSQLDVAAVRLEAAGFEVGSVARVSSGDIPNGEVISQDPLAGNLLQVGASIDLVASSGNAISIAAVPEFVYAGDTVELLVSAFDLDGNPVVPPPAYALALEFLPDEVTGPTPSVAGDMLTTHPDSRGVYVARATLDDGGDSGTVDITVLPPVDSEDGLFLFTQMADNLEQIELELGLLISAIDAGDAEAITQVNDNLQGIADNIDLESSRLTPPLSPENGFLPSLNQLSNAGFSQTPDDIRYHDLLTDLIFALGQTESLLLNQDPSSPYDDNAFEEQLNENLQFIKDELASFSPSLYGIVAAKDHLHQLISVRMPTIMQAELNRIDAILLSENLIGGKSGRSTGAPEKFFNLLGVMTAAQVRTKIIDDFYRPILKDMARASVVLAARGLLQSYLNLGELDAVITGASLSFHLFNLPGSTIEGVGMNTAYAPANDVFLIGPDAIGSVETILGTINADSIKNFDDLKKKFKEVKEAALAFNTAFNQANSTPDLVAFGCLFSFDPNCVELIYSAGFASVYEPGGFNFPAPVLIIARNLTTGHWGATIANFFPAANP